MRPPVPLLASLLLLGACQLDEEHRYGERRRRPKPMDPVVVHRPAAVADATDLRTRELELRLDAARVAWEREPSETNAIWVGRRLAYLGRYGDAVEWYRDRLEEHPDSHRLHRHLGHRLITLRRFEEAEDTLELAHVLASRHPNRIEPDGAPGPIGEPRSTTHGNIDYHLALARYLRGDFDGAAAAWALCATRWARNDDARVASVHWLYTSLVRAGRAEDARRALALVPDDPDVIENFAYADLVELYRGRRDADDLLASMTEPAQDAARAYGVARWLIANGEDERGRDLLESLAADGMPAAFGTIAAEVDVAAR